MIESKSGDQESGRRLSSKTGKDKKVTSVYIPKEDVYEEKFQQLLKYVELIEKVLNDHKSNNIIIS